MSRPPLVFALAAFAGVAVVQDGWAQDSRADARIRVLAYREDAVYSLHGFIGYQVDLEFEREERFVGLSAGDMQGLTFAAQENHLFLKPKAAGVRTNVTVLTNRHVYHLDYASTPAAAADRGDMLYAVRFTYAPPPAPPGPSPDQRLDSARVDPAGSKNFDYWYCGRASLQPLSAWDDGVRTFLRFGPRTELPALFVRNDDGSESLLNFNVQEDEVVIHRIAKRLIVRRGRLAGCIVNHAFVGSGQRLESGTVAPDVQRLTRGSADEVAR
jgi:type IV secretion system protein VirB9